MIRKKNTPCIWMVASAIMQVIMCANIYCNTHASMLPAAYTQAHHTTKIFVCHAETDARHERYKPFLETIVRVLRQEGFRTIYAPDARDGLNYGDNMNVFMRDAVLTSDLVILFITPTFFQQSESPTSGVYRELDHLKERIKESNKNILPICVTHERHIPYMLRGLLAMKQPDVEEMSVDFCISELLPDVKKRFHQQLLTFTIGRPITTPPPAAASAAGLSVLSNVPSSSSSPILRGEDCGSNTSRSQFFSANQRVLDHSLLLSPGSRSGILSPSLSGDHNQLPRFVRHPSGPASPIPEEVMEAHLLPLSASQSINRSDHMFQHSGTFEASPPFVAQTRAPIAMQLSFLNANNRTTSQLIPVQRNVPMPKLTMWSTADLDEDDNPPPNPMTETLPYEE
ncbi:MAG: toll/interleukin-1 receptor domain-containing protein [Alphaproteobacteria bacterium]|nr:toll/interleukin-1 receptor domain-containing protein [Alphaproteobacteria bacterium]